MPNVVSIRKVGAIAGQITYQAKIKYPHEPVYTVLFHGSAYGDGEPIVMQWESRGGAGEAQTFVTNPGRFGSFGPEWVRRFFSDEEA